MEFSKYRVKEGFSDIETHEVFLDKIAHIKEEELGISEKKFEVKIKEKVIYSIFGLFFILALILISKTFYLQVYNGNNLYTLAENNKGKISIIRPERGIIYDSNYKKIVVNSPAYDLSCDKRNFLISPIYSKEIKTISDILKKDFNELEELIASSKDSHVLVSENLSHETLLILEVRKNDLPDCSIEKNTSRSYVMGSVFSQVLGYNGRINSSELESSVDYAQNDYIGKNGLEKFYEKELRGVPGKTEVIRDAVGVRRGDKILSSPESGYNLVLNISSDLQSVVYNSLEKSIKNLGASKGSAVALDPKTGAVLALVSYPSYDNNIFSTGISQDDYNKLISDPNQPFFNRAIAAQYPTGSTIKPFLASAALQENIISPNKLINDPGYILIKNQYDPSITYRFGGVIPHGLVDIRKALAVSSNIYFYTIGGGYENQKGLGPTRIKNYLDMYGWESRTGIDLPGEFKGFIPSPEWKKQIKKESWWDGDTYNLSIGQSDLQVTPLQVAVAYAAIANGGTLYQPQVVQKVINGSGRDAEVIKSFEPKVNSKISIDPENLKIVQEGMRDGVQKPYGSSFVLNNLPVAVAGKTGTAETNKSGFFNTWSTSFAPYDDPEIVFVTTIEGVEGLRAATLPVAHDVLHYYFTKK